MDPFQPFEVNRFTFKSHAGRNLPGNFAPADFPLPRFRQSPPVADGLKITHSRENLARMVMDNPPKTARWKHLC